MGWKFQFIRWLRCNDRIWPNVVYFLTKSSSIILILKKILNCRYDHIIGPILLLSAKCCCFFMLGTENIQMVSDQEIMDDDQPDQSHSHVQQPLPGGGGGGGYSTQILVGMCRGKVKNWQGLRNELPGRAWKWGAPERAWAVLSLEMGGSGTSLIRFSVKNGTLQNCQDTSG